MCPHTPPCPAPSAPDREAAHTIVSHPEQGWSLLCNGVVIFEDWVSPPSVERSS